MKLKFALNLNHPCLKEDVECLILDIPEYRVVNKCKFKNILDLLTNMERLYEIKAVGDIKINKIKSAIFDFYVGELSPKQYNSFVNRMVELNS